MKNKKKICGTIGIYLGLNFFVVALLYVFYGIRPKTPIGWVALCTLGLPFWAGGEWLFDSINKKISKKYPSKNDGFSLKRVLTVGFVLTIFTILAFIFAINIAI